jgi:hypothetical protein
MADNEQIEGAAISNGESTDDLDSLKAGTRERDRRVGPSRLFAKLAAVKIGTGTK